MNDKEKKRKLDFSEIKKRHDEIWNINFFDVQIHCKFIIFPAHRYVLSSRSEFLAEQLASGVNKLNWCEFEDRTSAALLRWIYTNEVVFSRSTDVTAADEWLDLLLGSYKLQLVDLFVISEQKLLSLINDEPSPRFVDVSKNVGANHLLQKCLELKLNVCAGSPELLKGEIDEINTDHCCSDSTNSSEQEYRDEEFEEMLQLNKLSFGYHDFRQFSNIEVISTYGHDKWQAHAHVLESRSKTFLQEFKQTTEGRRIMRFGRVYGIEHTLLRWLYTDSIVFADTGFDATDLLKAAKLYDLPTLLEQCEQAIIEKVDITSCALFHKIAVKHNSATILKCCNQLISQYFHKAKSPDCSEMNVELEKEFDHSNSLSEVMVFELSNEKSVDGLLTLNDDCLLHLFRFVPLVDLGSIKDTCKRLSTLADRCFQLYADKSLVINSSSMFADIWILKHFGRFTESLGLYSFYDRYASRDNIFEMVVRFTDEHLKSISFHDCDRTEGETFECLKTVLKNVECIEVSWFNFDSNIDSLLNYCENLKEVTIDGDSIKLQTDWCSKNPNVTKFTMSGLRDDEIVEEICKKFTRLECLSVDSIETETNKLNHLSRLSLTLKKLKIAAILFRIDETLQQFADKTVLQDLTLSYADMTESLASVLGDFPNLSNLVFENLTHFNEDMQDILSEKLASIESLTFSDCQEITFKVIAKIIKNLLGLKKLSVAGCQKIRFIDRGDYLSLRKTRSLQIFLDSDVYERTCKLIGNSWLDNVQVEILE